MPSICLTVVVRTVRLLTLESLSASMNLIVKWMIFLLFPTVRKFAPILIFTAICISLNEVLCLPLRTLLSFIVKNMRLSPKILPIMSINTSISRMLSIRIRTPNGFEMEHIKVCRILVFLRIRSKLMQKIHSHLFFRMCESTHITIITGIDSTGVALAEFNLILLWVVELLDSVVSSRATIAKRALISMLSRNYILTYF